MHRIGVIGVGGMGSFHARTIAAFADAIVVAVSDPSTANTTALRDELGVSVGEHPQRLIDDHDLDGVVIASPDDTHAAFTVAALRAGLHVLCEKPLATNAADARTVLDAEATLDTPRVQLGFMREYDPAHAALQDARSVVGEIRHVRATHRNAHDAPRPLAEIVGQSLVHDVHTVRFVTGVEIVSVHASGSGAATDRSGADTFRHVVVLCRLADGAHATLEFDDCSFGYEVGVEVIGADGDLVVGHPARPTIRRAGVIEQQVGADWFGRFADAYRIQDLAWIESIGAGRATGPSAWDGYAAQCVVDAIGESLARGGPIDVSVPSA